MYLKVYILRLVKVLGLGKVLLVSHRGSFLVDWRILLKTNELPPHTPVA